MNVLTLQDVSQSYGTRRLFEDANMTFTDNKRIGLIGVNGTGKSTFMRMLAGLIEPEKALFCAMVRHRFIICPKHRNLTKTHPYWKIYFSGSSGFKISP